MRMGNISSSLYDHKGFLQRQLYDYTSKLKRVLSKSNSMETFDKEEVKLITIQIQETKEILESVEKAIEDEETLMF